MARALLNPLRTPSLFEFLPTEIRKVIYDLLLPDFGSPVPITLAGTFSKEDLAFIQALGPDHSIHSVFRENLKTCYGGAEGVERVRPQVKAAVALLAVCRMTRNEVAAQFYSNLEFHACSSDLLHNIGQWFVPSTRPLFRQIEMCLTPRHPGKVGKKDLCEAISGMTALQTFTVFNIDRSADENEKGTAFKPDTLQWLKAIQKALPQLTHSYYFDAAGDGSYVYLSNVGMAEPFEIGFNVNAEYQKWLDANARRRDAKKVSKERLAEERRELGRINAESQRRSAEGAEALGMQDPEVGNADDEAFSVWRLLKQEDIKTED